MAVVLAPAPSTQWFPCPHCGSPVPVVVPRDPPPLYSWEVLPELYPPLPPPRRSRWRAQRVVAFVLVAVAIVAIALLGALAGYGVEANAPAHYPVNGVVVEPNSAPHGRGEGGPLGGGGAAQTQTVGVNGSFYFFERSVRRNLDQRHARRLRTGHRGHVRLAGLRPRHHRARPSRSPWGVPPTARPTCSRRSPTSTAARFDRSRRGAPRPDRGSRGRRGGPHVPPGPNPARRSGREAPASARPSPSTSSR